MSEQKLATLSPWRQFLEGTAAVECKGCGRDEERYRHSEAVLRRLGDARWKRPAKGLVVRYLPRTTGYARPPLTRLIRRRLNGAAPKQACRAPAKGVGRRCTDAAVALLAETDARHGTRSGPATRHRMGRAPATCGAARYARLAAIAVGHRHHLRKRSGHIDRRREWTQTQPRRRPSGERRAPAPAGRPGFIRIDRAPPGDGDGAQGVYPINAVDGVTQWGRVATGEKISEACPRPVITALPIGFPFQILGFPTDNGPEYSNRQVAGRRAKPRVEFTKSRPRRPNDNGLAETGNGAVVRKRLGHRHIPPHFAAAVNAFGSTPLNPSLDFHRPCLFAAASEDQQGKIRQRYPRRLVVTPLEKLASLDQPARCPNPGVTLDALQQQAAARSDNAAAAPLNRARQRLFQSIHNRSRSAA